MLQSVLTRLLKELRDPELPVFLSCVLDGFEYEFSLGGKKKGEGGVRMAQCVKLTS